MKGTNQKDFDFYSHSIKDKEHFLNRFKILKSERSILVISFSLNLPNIHLPPLSTLWSSAMPAIKGQEAGMPFTCIYTNIQLGIIIKLWEAGGPGDEWSMNLHTGTQDLLGVRQC